MLDGEEDKKKKVESPSIVQKVFDGRFVSGTEIYASKLPKETKVYGELKEGTEYLIADLIYKCDYYTDEK